MDVSFFLHKMASPLQDKPTDAILCLQSAIRSRPTDPLVWECLAEAYAARGSYTAAMKAFDQVFICV